MGLTHTQLHTAQLHWRIGKLECLKALFEVFLAYSFSPSFPVGNRYIIKQHLNYSGIKWMVYTE